VDVDASLWASRRSHADTWLCRDTRGGNDSFREELAEGVKGPPPEFFLPEIPQYRRSLIRNTIAVAPFRGVGFGAVWEAPP
jgi:hypothetical protein